MPVRLGPRDLTQSDASRVRPLRDHSPDERSLVVCATRDDTRVNNGLVDRADRVNKLAEILAVARGVIERFETRIERGFGQSDAA